MEDFEKGIFEEIVKIHPSRRVSVSYDIYLIDNPAVFKVLPEHSGCFEVKNFIREVRPGDSLIMHLNPNKTLRSNDLTGIISIIHHDKNYLNLDCINARIENDKYILLLMLLFLKREKPKSYKRKMSYRFLICGMVKFSSMKEKK